MHLMFAQIYCCTSTDHLLIIVIYYRLSFQVGGGDTRDPEQEGGPAERKGKPAQTAGAECCSEEGEKRTEQVKFFIFIDNLIFFLCRSHFSVRINDFS